MGIPVFWHPAYEAEIGPHVFVTRKYRLAKERLVEEGTVREADVLRPAPASDADIGLVHDAEYVWKIRTGTLAPHERRALEVPFSEELREAMWLCTGGTILAGRLALGRAPAGARAGPVDCAEGAAANAADAGAAAGHPVVIHLGGGFHHAFPDHGEGFCLVNDVAVAVRRLRADGALDRVAVVDLDVHHGNGTAAIFADEPAVFTFSMHQQRNYPAVKPPSDLDLGLEDGTGDAEYLALLAEHLPRIVVEHRPELVFYLAGADPYRNDQLGGLALTKEGLRRRDALVFEAFARASIPAVALLAGGYAWRLADTVEIHCNTVRAAAGLGDG